MEYDKIMPNSPIGNTNCNTEKLINFRNFPYFTSPVNNINKKEILKNFLNNKLVCSLNVSICINCSHCFLKKIPKQKIKFKRIYY